MRPSARVSGEGGRPRRGRRSLAAVLGVWLFACGGGGGGAGGTADAEAGGGSTGGSTGGGQPPLMGAGLSVPAEARACEVSLFDATGELVEVVFQDGTRGQSLRRGARVTLAFVSTGGAIADAAVGLRLAAGGAGPTVESAACFGADGRTLEAGEVRVLTGGAP